MHVVLEFWIFTNSQLGSFSRIERQTRFFGFIWAQRWEKYFTASTRARGDSLRFLLFREIPIIQRESCIPLWGLKYHLISCIKCGNFFFPKGSYEIIYYDRAMDVSFRQFSFALVGCAYLLGTVIEIYRVDSINKWSCVENKNQMKERQHLV